MVEVEQPAEAFCLHDRPFPCLQPSVGKRNHQGIENVIPFPDGRLDRQDGPVEKAERLGGLLNFYYRQAG
jgi:hypothetical protein